MAKRQRKKTPEPTWEGSVSAIALVAAVLSFALYWPTLFFEFVNWDDWEYVVLNPSLGALDLEFARWSLTAFSVGNWHPATLISYGLDYSIWGDNAAGYHFTNVVLHAANSALVVKLAWLLFRRTAGQNSGSVFAAAVVGGLFACHPLHVESVAWISERKDVLYAFFWLLSLIGWLAYVDAGADDRRRRFSYMAALTAYALSAMSKPMAVTLPLVLLLLDVYPLGRLAARASRFRVVVLEKLPFYAISIATSVATLVAQQAGGAIGRADLAPIERLWVAVKALGFYLAKFTAPVTLVPLYPLEDDISLLAWPYWTSLALLVAITGAAVMLRQRAAVIGAGFAFYLLTLLPVLGIVEFGHHSAADRYTYLPMLGPAIVVGSGLAVAWRSSGRPRWIAVSLAVVVLAALGWRTTTQIFVWQNSVSLWQHVVSAYPDSSIGRYNLGHAFVIAGEVARAEAEWKRTLEIDASHTPALYELGAAAGRSGRYVEAERYFRAAVSSNADHSMARINLAMVLDELGDWQGASEHYLEFLRTAPPSLGSYVELARSRLEEHGMTGPQ